jgi:RNA polymerase sigma factor (sigma-70 family)
MRGGLRIFEVHGTSLMKQISTNYETGPMPSAIEISTAHASAAALAEFNKQRERLSDISGANVPALGKLRVGVMAEDVVLQEELVAFLKEHEEALQVVGAFYIGDESWRELDGELDVMVIGMDGTDAGGVACVRAVKNKMPRVQVMMLTTEEDGDLIFKSLLAGASGYLLRKRMRQELVQALQDVVRGGAALNSFIARKVVQFFQKRAPSQSVGVAVSALSEREREVLEHLSQSQAYKEIAAQLGISVETVRRHCHNIYEKMHVSSRTEAVLKYLER